MSLQMHCLMENNWKIFNKITVRTQYKLIEATRLLSTYTAIVAWPPK